MPTKWTKKLESEINNQIERVPQDIYWMVSYLREDSQDIKNEIRELRQTTQENYKILDNRIGLFNTKIDQNTKYLTEKIDQNSKEIRDLRVDIHQSLNKQQAWIVGTIITVSGLIVAIIKLL